MIDSLRCVLRAPFSLLPPPPLAAAVCTPLSTRRYMATALAPSPTRPLSPPPSPLLFLTVDEVLLTESRQVPTASLQPHLQHHARLAVPLCLPSSSTATSSPHNSLDVRIDHHLASCAATTTAAVPASSWWLAPLMAEPLADERASDDSASTSPPSSRSATSSSSTSDLSSGSPSFLQLLERSELSPPAQRLAPSRPSELECLALRQWSFAANDYTELHGALFVNMFAQLGLVARFGLCTERLYALWLAVSSSYRDNPYHNATHAFDVTQCLFAYLTSGHAAAVLEPLEQLALLFAGIMHDLEHPGVSNDFCFRTDHPLVASVQHHQHHHQPLTTTTSASAAAVLETHHISRACELLQDPELAVLACLSPAHQQAVLDLVPQLIIATYMGDHERYLKALSDRIESGLPATAPDFRLTLMQILIKGADLSNVARPFPVARFWANAIEAEFFLEV